MSSCHTAEIVNNTSKHKFRLLMWFLFIN